MNFGTHIYTLQFLHNYNQSQPCIYKANDTEYLWRVVDRDSVTSPILLLFVLGSF